MANPWITHLKAYRAKHKGMTLSAAMKAAAKTYKKKGPGATKVKKVKITKATKGKATKATKGKKATKATKKSKVVVEEM